MTDHRSTFDKFWKDKNGHQTLAQAPNAPLVVWFVTMLLAKLVTHGLTNRLLETLSFGSLFVWAWLELFKGDSYFRRILGAVMLVLIIKSRAG